MVLGELQFITFSYGLTTRNVLVVWVCGPYAGVHMTMSEPMPAARAKRPASSAAPARHLTHTPEPDRLLWIDACTKLELPADILQLLQEAPSVTLYRSSEALLEAAAPDDESFHQVGYEVPGRGYVLEANVCRTRNGLATNYAEAYMRRRDPDCMFVGDTLPTDKPRFEEAFGMCFDDIRRESLDWLRQQRLAVFFFNAGKPEMGTLSMVIAPANAAFFAFGLSLLQGILSPDAIAQSTRVQAFVFVVPPFRHSHFGGKQVVVHHRASERHELFSYNLYPGPSAKKGIYGILLSQGEREQWVTAHCSAVQVTTPSPFKVTV